MAKASSSSPEGWTGDSGINRRLWILNDLGGRQLRILRVVADEMGQLPLAKVMPD